MDFTFTEEQQAAVEAAKAVFSGVAPDRVPSPALTQGAVAEDFDRPLWARLAGSDLLSLVLAAEHGGAGLDPIALCLVLRESAKVLARVPLLETSAVAMAVQAYGAAELAAEVLPRVGRGELVLTAAANGRTGHDPAELAVTARRNGDDWLLDGVQTGVPWAQCADRIAVPAHTGAGRAVLALVPRDQPGVTLADQVSTSGERFAEVRFEAVRISAHRMIGAEGAWEWLRDLLTTGTCALALGLGERVLAMTSEYTGKREQFGFPVATFQAVAVQAADRYIDLRAMEATLWQAAWRLATGAPGALPVTGDVAVAKIWASDGVRRVVQTAQHLHGGFGADTDYPLHRYHAWAKQIELSLGPAAAHEEALGDLLAAHPLG
ncbi:acyl-CoA dehydrogenase [Streptomyces agglomeratus]|uniref:acyl-CoA dehydrogenase family protein n=1 Tax=Streptomyces agglomeratus TaxID=285458 RepID=UPI0008548602|nr:acyl-CoA dehydrogenase family protein [Streptomyces agglomeratus]OEJ39952.1 acyl-CoA dehydrogenase [Streptomyces agglomeratus]OEJ45667.1 acyl-CoA dehydrogenase [Streptomyces agglomeratus]OEJ59872.1 acyl-CoA dehydrogenase [Streptomyces agglomeratus]